MIPIQDEHVLWPCSVIYAASLPHAVSPKEPASSVHHGFPGLAGVEPPETSRIRSVTTDAQERALGARCPLLSRLVSEFNFDDFSDNNTLVIPG
jgi:hypothetical protein